MPSLITNDRARNVHSGYASLSRGNISYICLGWSNCSTELFFAYITRFIFFCYYISYWLSEPDRKNSAFESCPDMEPSAVSASNLQYNDKLPAKNNNETEKPKGNCLQRAGSFLAGGLELFYYK